MQAVTPEKKSISRRALPAILTTIPAVLFTGAALRFLEDIPYWDDYPTLLQFTNTIVQSHGNATKFLYFLAAQNNEYKLFFAHGVTSAEVALTGRVNFAYISLLGDSAVLLIALILWSRFLPNEKDLARRLAFFVPIPWLLFQLQYWEAIDWPVDALQNLWVIVFVMGAIDCLLRPSRKSFAGAIVLYVLAIGAMGNGLLLLPLGLLILVRRRQLVRIAAWIAVSAICLAAYAYQYNIMSSQAPPYGSTLAVFLWVHPVYALAFMGNAGAIAGESRPSVAISVALAMLLLALFGWLLRRGYAKRNQFVSYCVLFILLTALGVASMRSGLGLRTSVTSRYTIFGLLLLILAWAAICEEFFHERQDTLLRNTSLWAVIIVSVAFSLSMDLRGYREMSRRRDQLVQGMAAFEHSPAGRFDGPTQASASEPDSVTALRGFFRGVLCESIRLGVYEPPKF
jgi:hypothetical protein